MQLHQHTTTLRVGCQNSQLDFRAADYPDYKLVESWMIDRENVASIIIFTLKQPGDVVMGHVEIRKIES